MTWTSSQMFRFFALVVGARSWMDLEFYALEPGLDGTVLLTDFQGHTKKDRKADNQAGC